MEKVAKLKTQMSKLASQGGSDPEPYKQLLRKIFISEDDLVDCLKAFIEAIVNENVSLVISRQLLSEVGAHLTKLQKDSIAKAVSHYTLEIVQPRVISFENQARSIRQNLFSNLPARTELASGRKCFGR